MRVRLLAFALVSLLAVEFATAEELVKLRGNGGSAPGCIGWLSMTCVQQELKLQPEQVVKARELAGDLRQQWDEAMKKFEALPRQEQLTKRTALADTQYEEGMKALGTFLKPEQVDRFDQILFQSRGARALREPRVVEALKLTDAQKKRINTVVIQSLNEHNRIFQSTRNDPIALESKILANTKEFRLRAEELLDADQKKIWDRISGPHFEKVIGDSMIP